MKKVIFIIGILIVIGLALGMKKDNTYIKHSDNTYVAVVVNGEEASSIPEKGNYKVKTTCPNALASWDYDNWELNVININKTTKCMLDFTNAIPVNLADYVMSLASGDEVYNEPETDYRYEGENPNNYIAFNGELWRIIGVFSDNTHGKSEEKLVKIIRNNSLGGFAWDKSNINNWPASSLYNLLNQYYYNGLNEWAGDYCYQYGSTIKGKCDFTITGITSDYYRNMIEEVTWKLGGIAEMSSVATVYAAERGTTVYSDMPYHTTGYIGLIYPSDYGYSVLSSSCGRTKNLDSYNNDNCAGSAWLRGEGYEWTLTPCLSNPVCAWSLYCDGKVHDFYNVLYGIAARPVLYLKSNAMKLSGTGSSSDPYIIKLN